MSSFTSQHRGSITETADSAGQSSAAAHWAERQRWATRHAPIDLAKPRRHADAAHEWAVSQAVTLISPTRRYLRGAERVLSLEAEISGMCAARFGEQVERCRQLARRGKLTRDVERTRALAVVREAGRRAWGLNAYRPQVAGAWALLEGRMTEMATGEGKTLVAALAAAILGWRGRGCHVVTVNDYLARRDAQWAQPFMTLCGLSVAHVVGDTPPSQRAAGYHADVTYTTHQNAAADYLRDQLAQQMPGGPRTPSLPGVLARQLAGGVWSSPRSDQAGGSGGSGLTGAAGGVVMRGLAVAIVDEADSVLLDEAVTPLIISGSADDAAQAPAFTAAAEVADRLVIHRDFRLDLRHRDLHLTRRGRQRIDQLCTGFAGPLGARGKRYRQEMIHQALTARHLFLRGDQYVVQDGKIVIVDHATGRLMPDRAWRAGLHQAVEAKEGVEIQELKSTLASISFQRFFRSYHHLAGMTGTAWSDRAELWRTYRLRTTRIPTHRPCRRRHVSVKPFRSLDEKWDAVVVATRRHLDQGRPVLVGTRSVEDSDTLSQRLAAAGIPHEVLNARSHLREAEIVAEAGKAGRVTVATNMAGRGTDIKLDPGVAENGGLVVLATDRHESPRVDRQMQGRAGRQGEPGLAVTFTSLEDPLCRRYARLPARWLQRLGTLSPALGWHLVFRLAQGKASHTSAHQRRQVQLRDEHLAEQVGF